MTADATLEDPSWLAAFHDGERRVLERCYREHVARVLAAASRVLPTVDAETVTHEVFYRLLSDPAMRASFTGGNLGAWLARVASNAAIDHQRRRGREVRELDLDAQPSVDPATSEGVDDELSARILVERFRRERLPEKWRGVFDARFLRQLPQRTAAAELGMERSTLAYQEQQIRALLRSFLLGVEEP